MEKPIYGYKAFYNGKSVEIYTNLGKYDALVSAAKHFGLKDTHKIAIALCEKDGKQITHTADF